MDIWSWIRDTRRELRSQGNGRLAQLLERLPSIVCAGQHARVDALVPEALALARAVRSPWLEVFIRHWYLQSKIFHRYEVQDALPEAVSLLERASREDARDCPQSVCVTQDLAQCYAQLDGPGYVEERLAVARETLERIDPTWPCFACISSEYASALLDARRFDEAQAFVAEQRRALAEVGDLDPGGRFGNVGTPIALASGQLREALVEAERWQVQLAGKSARMGRDLLRCQVLSRLGRLDEAAQLLPTVHEVLEAEDNYESWARAMRDFVRHAGERAADVMSWDVAYGLRIMYRRMVELGALYGATTVARMGAHLALARRARRSAELFIESAAALVSGLRAPDRLLLQLDELRAQVDALAPVELAADVDADELLAALGDDAERDLDVVEAARARWPAHEGLACLHASALQELGYAQRAEDILRRFVAAHEGAEQVFHTLAEILLLARKHERLAELLASRGDELSVEAMWFPVRSAHIRGEHAAAVQALDRLLERAPGDIKARVALAKVERERCNWAQAVHWLDQLVAELEPGGCDWDRMVAATVLEQWDKVRHSAERLELDVDAGPGAIDEHWGPLLLQYAGEDEEPVFAERTGPVTAQVFQVASPGRPQHFRDLVVFEPTPLEEPDEDEEPDEENEGEEGEGDQEGKQNGRRELLTFPVVHVLRAGRMACYPIDGVHPGEEVLSALIRAIEERGGTLDVRSDERYRLQLEPEGESVTGLYAFAALPVDVPARDVHQLFAAKTAGVEHPMVWVELASLLDDPDEMARQRALVEQYEL